MAGRKKTAKKVGRRAAQEEPDTEEETGEEEEDGAEDGEEEEEEEEETENNDIVRPELTKKEKGELFKAYQASVDTLKEIDEARELAKEELGEKVKDIFDKLGQGPFVWKGATIKVVTRKGNCYMRTLSSEAEEIEA